ncbi:hypothetical protein Bhyg_04957, partial [Pseudolycoriella hygida]
HQKSAIQRPYAAGRNREDPMTAPKWPPQEQQFDVDQDSHIFNHKGGLQIPNTISNNLAQQYIANNGFAVPQSDAYMQSLQDTYRIPSWSPEQRVAPAWPQQQPPQIPMMVQPIQQQLQPLQQDILESQIQQQRPDWPVRPVANTQMDNHAVVNPIKIQKLKVQTDNNSQDSDEESEYDEDEKTVLVTEPPPKKKQRKHKKQDIKTKINKDKTKKHEEHEHDKPMHEQLKSIKSDLDMEFIDHDGAADRPGGAVLSLTLGIIVTAALAVLVGCRATVVRRRSRRGGKSQYAHDADFLVNGIREESQLSFKH